MSQLDTRFGRGESSVGRSGPIAGHAGAGRVGRRSRPKQQAIAGPPGSASARLSFAASFSSKVTNTIARS